MLSFEPSIVFVDDKEEEVEGIVRSYRDEGYGVKFYNADVSDGDEKPIEHFHDVNLIFLDLYYNENFDVELCTGWIESLIPEGSFYVLVIWSKDTDKAKDVIENLIEIKRKPYLDIVIQKGDEYKHSDNTWDFEKLSMKIKDEVEVYHALDELAQWKKSIKCSSNIVVGHLSKNAQADELNKKLKKIIVGHGGTSCISDDKYNIKREILFDALDNVLISNAKGVRALSDISAENKANLYKIEDSITADVDTMLNSWFHFTLSKEPLIQSEIRPGLVCKYINNDLKGGHSLLDDENIKGLLKVQIAKSLEEGSNTKIVDIVVLMSRPCDIAQNKFGRNLKLMSGVFVYKPVRKENAKKDIKTGQKYDSMKIYDHLYLSDTHEDVAIVFDYRYIFSVPKDIFIKDFENIKVFNKELLSEIQVEYGAYSSRLGITQVI